MKTIRIIILGLLIAAPAVALLFWAMIPLRRYEIDVNSGRIRTTESVGFKIKAQASQGLLNIPMRGPAEWVLIDQKRSRLEDLFARSTQCSTYGFMTNDIRQIDAAIDQVALELDAPMDSEALKVHVHRLVLDEIAMSESLLPVALHTPEFARMFVEDIDSLCDGSVPLDVFYIDKLWRDTQPVP